MQREIEPLEEQVHEIAKMLAIPETAWEQFMGHMKKLAAHNISVYRHSLRVGIYSFGLAKKENSGDLALPFLGGMGHDIGKYKIPNEILNKNGLLTSEEFEIIKKHPEYGFEELKDDFPEEALVAGAHHCYQPEPYGIHIEMNDKIMSQKMEDVVRLIRIADFFDGRMTRIDKDKKGDVGAHDPAQFETQHAQLQEFIPNYEARIAWLKENKFE